MSLICLNIKQNKKYVCQYIVHCDSFAMYTELVFPLSDIFSVYGDVMYIYSNNILRSALGA